MYVAQRRAEGRRLCEDHLGDDVPERKVLYEDPELGFCILGHVYRGAKDSHPHDHGPSWAIYGQAQGETAMTDYEPVARPGGGNRARPAASGITR